MKDLETLNRFRAYTSERQIYGQYGGRQNGCFTIPSPGDKKTLVVIASTGDGWEHVSVSRQDHVPSWGEMEYIKRLFFKDDEAAMQLHPPLSDYVNCHPRCLHLWRPTEGTIPLPPKNMVG